ncbi:MAG: type II toxin-antitoxin system RelE/ParE family toxin [Prevotella sp.]|jgi:plasmid stabilization system protein ParE|nr:type II toxin-antitoxin system RelE/ParE family toxin [Prevotella sp.]
MNYKIEYSADSHRDVSDLYEVILYEYFAPATAKRYVKGIIDTVNTLKKDAPIYQIQTRASLRQYGQNVRRINYKKMSIIYTIHGDVVYIHRIVASSLISGL